MPETAENNLPARDVIRHLTHELRQPLSAMESIAFYLQMTVGGGKTDISAQIDRLQQMVESANWVLSDVLHLMQLAPAAPEVVNVGELADEVLAESWLSDGLELEYAIPDDLPGVWVDPDQLRHLMRSVLQFFRRSAGDSRAVELSAEGMGDVVRLEFCGEAPGIALDALFNPFEANQLLSCRRILENNGGTLAVDRDERGWLRLGVNLVSKRLESGAN